MSFALVLLGALGLSRLGVREYPAVDPPIVTVTTNYPGANPAVIDSLVTEPLESAINGIPGVRTLSSTSRDGSSVIRVELGLDVDLDAAAADVRDKVAGALRRLPPDVDPPIVEKADADAEPVVFLTVESDTRSILEVAGVADTLIRERMQTIPGVAGVRIFGDKRWAMRLALDTERLAAHGITPLDVRAALERENLEIPAGRIEGGSLEVSLRTIGRLSTPEQFERLVVRRDGERVITLGDVGSARLGAENERTGVKRSGVPMIGVAVVPQPNTNAIAIADEFYRRLRLVERDLPPEYRIDLGYDFTRYVRRSIREVEETLFVAFALVAAVIFLFLRDVRAALVPVVAIPVSIVSAFFVMWVAGFTVNTLTLIALVLAIGLVCDDAIVVLESVYAKVERGMDPAQAAREGSREIYFAVVVTTIALIVVFLPVVLLPGLTGRLFRELVIVLSGAVLASAFVALSLAPMMCRYLLVKRERPPWLWRVTEPAFVALTRAHRWVLGGAMRVRWLAVPALGAAFYGIVAVARGLPAELAPLEDRSNLRVMVRAPEGATYDYTADAIDELGRLVEREVPEVARSFSITGMFGGPVNTGLQNVYLKEAHERTRTQEQIFQQLARSTSQVTAVRVFPSQPPTIGGRFAGQPVQFVLQATTLPALLEVLPRFMERASALPSLRFVDIDLKLNRPEGVVEIDRERAAALGVSVGDVGRTLQLAFGDARVGWFTRDGRQYQVLAQAQRSDRNDPSDLRRLHVRAASGALVPLESLVRYEERASPAALYRYDRYLAATVTAGIAPGRSLSDAIGELDALRAEVLPEGFATALAGQSRDFADSSSSLLYAFLLAIAIVYLVLAAQFESFRDPWIVLITVPASLVGALGSLWLTGQSLNVFSQIGLVMLIGLVTKNGILIVELANQRREAGVPAREAALEAAEARFRPILMTSLSTLLGVLPLALALGSGTGSRRSLGIAVLGGLTVGTALSLYLVPAVYGMVVRDRPRAESSQDGVP
ncbi:MAG: efflux RND transporter permease subunit [Polyangiaceae bacterium]|nr:efflux RND transporter permease subunit [Polyangiaceae bacterium]